MLVVALTGEAHAIGGPGNGAGGENGPGGPIVWVGAPGTDPSGTAGGSGTVTCGLREIVGGYQPGAVWAGAGDEPNPPIEGTAYWLVCSDGFVTVITYQAANVIDSATLARRAFAELPLVYPRPRTAPPVTVMQLVGVPTWLWVDQGDWQTMSATASIVGLSATVTAQPTKVVWTMGDGSTVTCEGPGTAYDPSVPDSAQSTDCSHTYQHDGAYTVLATIVWTVSWTATNGQGGTLPNVQRSTQFSLDVEQRQAVING